MTFFDHLLHLLGRRAAARPEPEGGRGDWRPWRRRVLERFDGDRLTAPERRHPDPLPTPRPPGRPDHSVKVGRWVPPPPPGPDPLPDLAHPRREEGGLERVNDPLQDGGAR